jgi:hypothetical protein
MFLVDGHLDLSMNAIEWNRDLTRPLAEVRQREAGKTDKVDRGKGVAFQMRAAVELAVATDRMSPATRCRGGLRRRSPGRRRRVNSPITA